jgi:3-hydroxy-9,10-secoandrosta-1,3,5(10)-triene-9,17-dione monooxygenase reductase component
MSDNKQPSIDFRNALGSFTTGVTVVTALGRDGQKIGMTANSFNSVSLDPALVLWSIARDANCFDDFIAAKSYAIHVLTADQQDISNRFAKSGEDKFAGIECSEGLSGVPILPHYSACFQCNLEHQYEGGDHIILVGKVLEFVDNGHKPLVFYRGQYSAI